jgi:GNAT superfamily N-acetyltransferase
MNWRALAGNEAETIAAACVTFDPYLRLGYRAETLIRYLTRPDPALDRYAIETDGRLIGVLALRRPWLRGPLIEMLALLPEAQGRGHGSAILDRCKTESGNNLWATVSAFHQPARHFYAKAGFQEVCALPDIVQEGEDELLLRWRKSLSTQSGTTSVARP